MSERRQVRDPVFGFIPINGKEAEIVDTPVFQRLRGIRQLAFANLVYPGALNTRFDHSLGVCHVSGMMAKLLLDNEEDRRLVRVAALLHDIGHGPFSHVSEEALEIYADRDSLGSLIEKREKIHELVTTEIIRNDRNLERIIGASDRDKICKLLSEGFSEPILRSLISGPLDADKQDYLLRDSHFCGVKYGLFDIGQLHRELKAKDDIGGKQLMISEDGIHAVEQFVLAKYYITTQVYRHPIRLITDQMLVRAIVLGIDKDGIDELSQLYGYDGSKQFVERYVAYDDSRFLADFSSDRFKDKHSHDLLSRLKERRLLKRVYHKSVNKFQPGELGDAISQVSSFENRCKRGQLESALYDVLCEVTRDSQCAQID